MAEDSAESLAERAFELNLIDARELELIRNEIGGVGTVEAFRSVTLRKELLTNYQYDKLIKGDSAGFFYGNYKVLYLTGTGTFARVYRAVQKETGKIFAVKVLRSRHRDKPNEVESFVREGELGVQLRHPNIVPIYEVGKTKQGPFLVMDFIEGQNLRDFVKVRKKLDVNTSLRLTTDILTGLAYAATKGIFHRDLKLSNALVTSRGSAKLVDFGLYGVKTSNDSSEKLNVGTIDYVTLEKLGSSRRDDPRSDLYFAGCMFYQMLTGVAPLLETRDKQERQAESRFRNVVPIISVDSTLPRSITTVVQKAMEINAERRYQAPAEMLFDLQIAAKRLAAGEESGPAGTTKVKASKLEGAAFTILVVESKIEMQNMLRDRLKKYGYRVLVMSDPTRAIQRFQDDEKAASCVIFSTIELEDGAVDAFNEFGTTDATKNVPAILFVDAAQQDFAAKAMLDTNRVVLKMPMTVRDLRDELMRLLGEKDAGNGPSPA